MARSKDVSKSRLSNVVMEGVRIVFRNFSGKEGQYNREGDRNFAVILDDELGEEMLADGWNVKYLKPRDEDDTPTPYLQVKVSFRGRPPRIVMITSRGRTPLGEDEVSILDWADLANVDLIVNPYHWDVNGRQGVSAYLQTIFATIEEDELELKYADVPDSAQSAIGGRDTVLQITDGEEIVLGDDEVTWDD